MNSGVSLVVHCALIKLRTSCSVWKQPRSPEAPPTSAPKSQQRWKKGSVNVCYLADDVPAARGAAQCTKIGGTDLLVHGRVSA